MEIYILILQATVLLTPLIREHNCLSIASPPGNITKTRIVSPQLLKARGSTGDFTVILGDDLVLNLRKTFVFSPSFKFSSHRGNLRVTNQISNLDVEQHLYHDPEREAALIVSEDDGLRITGVIGNLLRIRPSKDGKTRPSGTVPHELIQLEQRSTESDAPNAHGSRTQDDVFKPVGAVYEDDTSTYRPDTGYAVVGGACSYQKVAIVEDIQAVYSGILVFAHELAHVLGAYHDGWEAQQNMAKLPSTLYCPPDVQYILGSKIIPETTVRFSACTALQILAFSRTEKASCLTGNSGMQHQHGSGGKSSITKMTAEDFCRYKHPMHKEVTYSRAFEDENPPKGIKQCIAVCYFEEHGKNDGRVALYNAPNGILCDEEDPTKVA